MSNLKTIQKKISTKNEGVFYKEIVNVNNKVVDKIFLIRYREGKCQLHLIQTSTLLIHIILGRED